MNKQPNAEPNQTEQRIGEDFEQFIIDQINQSYNEHKGSNEAVQDAAYFITKKIESNLSLARKQVIEEIEGYINQCNNGISISLLDFKTYLQTLKK